MSSIFSHCSTLNIFFIPYEVSGICKVSLAYWREKIA
ncbi:hypothetical protein EPIR_2903 [Erwinia piriflorinigrans CFBP 5888]|uniref:Uncharacterized protein n=1 Tax=Erwinia piriflorinigrans CFBP 5888 TaxID=1161919 RepID=V5ZBH6_9GAMM|nr:hypothetical protein EPIR_2903 [Erwinia piriflorinigrans CFBP 5888]